MKTIFAALIALLVISTTAFAADVTTAQAVKIKTKHFNISLGGGYAFSQIDEDQNPFHTQGITFDQTPSLRLGFEYKPLSWLGLELAVFGEQVKPTPHGGGAVVTYPQGGGSVVEATWGSYDVHPNGWPSGSYVPFRTTWDTNGTYTYHATLQPHFYYNMTKWLSAFIGGGVEYSRITGDYEADGWTGILYTNGSIFLTEGTWKIRYAASVTELSPIASFGLQGHLGHFSLSAIGEWTAEKQEIRFGDDSRQDSSSAQYYPTNGQLIATIQNPWRASLNVSYSF